MQVDSLVISLGLDPAGLEQGIASAAASLDGFLSGARSFADGFMESFQEAAGGMDLTESEIAQIASIAEQALGQMEDAARSAAGAIIEGAPEAGAALDSQLGPALQDIMDALSEAADDVDDFGQAVNDAAAAGGAGMRGLGNEIRKTGSLAEQTAAQIKGLVERGAGFVKNLVTRLAVPMAGLMTAGAVAGSYFSDVAQMAEQTGRYTKEMEEAYRKKALLARINKEDIELYRKGKLAMLEFNKVMGDISAIIMRALGPAINLGIGILQKFSGWIDSNKGNILRFITVLAGLIGAVLTPAFIRLGVAMLANPLTWLIAGLLLLALIIDDFITYLQGGESAFGDFWSMLGTGEEITKALGDAWEWLKGVGIAVWEALKEPLASYWAYFKQIWGSVFGIVQNAVNLIKAIFAGDWTGAGESLMAIFSSAWNFVKTVFTAIQNIASKVLTWIKDKITGILPDWVKKLLGIGGGDEGGKSDEVPQEAPPMDPQMEAQLQAFKERLDPAAMPATQVQPPAPVPNAAQLTANAVPVEKTVNNNSETNIEVQNNTTINATNIDPNAIAGAASGAIGQAGAKLGYLAAESGVRQ